MQNHPRDHGLLFRRRMVEAYFGGRKYQTRRPIRCGNSYIDGWRIKPEQWEALQFDRAWIDPGPSPAGNAGPYLKVPRDLNESEEGADSFIHRVYPVYQVGDSIWGKESWRVREVKGRVVRIMYFDETEAFFELAEDKAIRRHGHWRSARYLPRKASRIVAKILASCPERIGDISEEDARAEGVESREDFVELWDSIHGEGAFESNEWVWAVTFEQYSEERTA